MISFFSKIIINIMMKIEFRGLNNIPKKGESYIMCSNHISNFDPMVISFKLKNKVRFIAKKELFQNKTIGFLLKKCGNIPMDRGTGDLQTIGKCIDVIREDKNILGVFPEGRRSKDGIMARFKSGAIFMTREAKADILPVSVHIVGGAYKFRCRYVVTYGELIPYEAFNLDSDDKRALRDAKKLLEEKIKKLLPEECIKEGSEKKD